MARNVFIIGLTDYQRDVLTSTHNPRDTAFHGLLDFDDVVIGKDYSLHALLDRCRRILDRFTGRVDAIIAHWDFPTSVLAPILCHEYGIPAPTLESVLKCEHKYWSRMEQARATPDCVPGFNRFDPFDDQALAGIGLDFPFWIKPVKSFSSQMGFKIRNSAEFQRATARIRAGINRLGHAFDQALAMVDLPEEIRGSTGTTCIAEEIIHGLQAAPEGSIFQGEHRVHGIIDMDKDASGNSLERLTYPSTLPPGVQQRMIGACRKLLAHIGFDNGCFNAEFMWDAANDKLLLIEVNTRISQAHSDLFAKVDGQSNLEVAIDVARGVRPDMPRGQGKYAFAAQYIIPRHKDGVVTRMPGMAELANFRSRFPDTHVHLDVKPGVRLADLPNQDSYRYVLGTLYLGAQSYEALERKYRDCLRALPFDFAPAPAAAKPARTGKPATARARPQGPASK